VITFWFVDVTRGRSASLANTNGKVICGRAEKESLSWTKATSDELLARREESLKRIPLARRGIPAGSKTKRERID
jgi:hypothetical protein